MRPVGTPGSAESRPSTPRVDFNVDSMRYRHWRLAFDGPVATLTLDVDTGGGLVPGYELKLNSYDLGVDIEFYDAIQRMRFEHPEVRAVVLTSGKEKVFCVGANIRMLAAAPHPWKVNFCTFTNETRNGIEDATANSGQVYVAAVNGSAFGGGYELALACQHIMLIDDQSAVVSLPKLPLLGVGPGTGGLTRLLDKRHVRRDLADYFASKPEGVGGEKAVQWRLVDEAVSQPRWQEAVAERAAQLPERSARAVEATGIALTPLEKTRTGDEISYRYVTALLEPGRGVAEITVSGPETDAPSELAGIREQRAGFSPLAVTRELDDLILDLRINEPELGTWVLRTEGDTGRVLAYDRLLLDNRDDWLANEIIHYLKRTLKRLDVTSRSLIALIEPGSCFAGALLEIALAADRQYILDGPPIDDEDSEERATIRLSEANFGAFPMGNGLTRLQARFYGDDAKIPNNVNLSEDRRLQRALEGWQPKFMHWWGEMGPTLETQGVYLRTAVSVGREGWAHFDHVNVPDYRWGIFLAERDPDRRIAFGEHQGEPVWQQVPGEYRADLKRLIVVQGDTEPASVEQQRLLGSSAPSLYDLRNLFQVNVEEGRHLWAMVYLLHAYFGREGRDEAELLLNRHSGDRDSPRILGAFNEETTDWLQFFMFTYFTDRDGKYQLGTLKESGFDPLARTCEFMLKEEAHHMFVGTTGVQRVVERTAERMAEHDTEDIWSYGGIPLSVIQKYLNFQFSVSMDLFGSETSSNVASYYTAGLKGRWMETRRKADHQLHDLTMEVPIVADGQLTARTVPMLTAPNLDLRNEYSADC